MYMVPNANHTCNAGTTDALKPALGRQWRLHNAREQILQPSRSFAPQASLWPTRDDSERRRAEIERIESAGAAGEECCRR
jgi:hypothetical protein